MAGMFCTSTLVICQLRHSVGEMKSKPVQTSVRILNGSGIQPDFLICRAEQPLDDRRKETLAWVTSVPAENIISAPNVDTIYRVPMNFEQQHLTDKILAKFGNEKQKNRFIRMEKTAWIKSPHQHRQKRNQYCGSRQIF